MYQQHASPKKHFFGNSMSKVTSSFPQQRIISLLSCPHFYIFLTVINSWRQRNISLYSNTKNISCLQLTAECFHIMNLSTILCPLKTIVNKYTAVFSEVWKNNFETFVMIMPSRSVLALSWRQHALARCNMHIYICTTTITIRGTPVYVFRS